MRALLHSRWVSLSAKLGLTAAAFWFVAKQVEINHVQDFLRDQQRDVLIEAVLLIGLQVVFGMLRWRAILQALSGLMRFAEMANVFYVSAFFNCCLPGTVGGDVVRVWLMKNHHIPLPLSISSVVIDRILTLFALALLSLVTLPVLATYLHISAWVALPVLLLLTVLGLCLLFNLDRLLERSKLFAAPGWLQHFMQSLRLLLVHRVAAAKAVAGAVAAHISYCVCAYVLAGSLGAPISALDAVTLLPWVLLISMVPISVGGWGLRELAMVYFLGLVGMPKAAALALSVQLGLLAMLVTLPGGVLWLVQRKKTA